MKNKKGFTLVELLAVIVILALIMSIAVISIGGVLDSSKASTYKETAASIIDGVKKQLLINNKLDQGDYTFTAAILERGGQQSPYGGNIIYTASCASGTEVAAGSGICKINSDNSQACSATATSFVRILADKTAAICLAAGANNKYIDSGTKAAPVATEAALLGSGTNMIK